MKVSEVEKVLGLSFAGTLDEDPSVISYNYKWNPGLSTEIINPKCGQGNLCKPRYK